MSTVLTKCLQDILRKVEEVSGRKVKIVEKRGMSLPVIAKIARGDMPSHIFYLDSAHEELAYHSIAHECVHILRLYSVAREKRIVPMATAEMRSQAFAAIEADIHDISTNLTDELLQKMRNFWYDSIMRQLSNFPPDVMIEKWLYKFYPELRPIQMKAIRFQAENAAGGLKREVEELTPRIIYDASNVMNYAYFHLVGKLLEIDFELPYRNTRFVVEGMKLVAITTDGYEDNYEGDVAMIQLWADFFGLSDWFAWIDLENVPV